MTTILIRALKSHQKAINVLNIHEVRILIQIPFVSVEKTTDLWRKYCVRMQVVVKCQTGGFSSEI